MSRRNYRSVLATATAFCLLAAAEAEVRLPRIFTDNMVLQQELPIAVWGWADAGEEVTVTLAGATMTAKAGRDGRWRVDLPAMKADGKGRTLTIVAGNTVTLKNILLGEVWLCSGQSNMNRGVQVKEDDPDIRLFWIDGSVTPLRDDLGATAGWVPSTAKGLAAAAPISGGRFAGKPRKSFTEVGYVFGRRLHKELKVPVGLIKAAFGGSNVRAWTPQPNVAELYTFGEKVEGSYLGHRPGLLYQGMIHGMVPFTIRGVVWYQGENDGRSKTYHTDMKAWIESWRKLWGRDDLPFYMVQIAPTTYAGGRMQYIWEAQSWVMHNVPHTALAVSNDILPERAVKIDKATGWPKAGGGNPHPPNKHIVAERLANIALVKTYGRAKQVLFGPMLDSHTIEGEKVTVKLKYVGGGLTSRDGKPLNWFQLSPGKQPGERQSQWFNARAEIVGKDTLVVSSPEVKTPKYIRFAWNCEARPNLMNAEGLPAVSFRTDDEAR